MSWLNEIQYEFRYECAEGHLSVVERTVADDIYDDTVCSECGKEASYRGFNPLAAFNLRGKVAFDQNGRRGYRITDGKGNVRHVSASKHNYLEYGEARPGYTREYENKLRAAGRTDMLEVKSHETLVKERKEALKGRAERVKAITKAAKESAVTP